MEELAPSFECAPVEGEAIHHLVHEKMKETERLDVAVVFVDLGFVEEDEGACFVVWVSPLVLFHGIVKRMKRRVIIKSKLALGVGKGIVYVSISFFLINSRERERE
ncbi:hypothetical protein MA16_Dca022398 [Dendrobium catenatum]|uniref:Uncharacterized protein n=1 Tax=Dendrobium catenatum TaxID=906689 RepID=A0A2I0VTA5_9ASPA|nr:hypothetical protein MA16_Dca022398 [Dendrobium catenatum]